MNPPTANPTKLICICVTIIAIISALTGAFLLWKGYAGGELLASQSGIAIGGLLGIVSQNRNATPSPTTEPIITPIP